MEIHLNIAICDNVGAGKEELFVVNPPEGISLGQTR